MSTYHCIHFHIIFSTKHRKPWIADTWIHQLHAYLGGTLKGLEAVPLKIGGVSDHVHMLVGCKTTHCPADLVRETKSAATLWVHKEIKFAPFAWQEGYAIFSLSPDACPGVAKYIEHQAAHHQKKSSLDELKELLAKAGVQYDPKYLE
ncbi:IS200/IS605 family transposase [Rosistilla oblonga]|uniref:IS200/IS605 family transposase n=1 Tax=Rosistilla oblonga TaxID=2527990 RepID=UPI003A96F672